MASAADLEAAAILVRYSIASAAFVFDSSVRDPRLDKLRRAVDEARAAGLTDSQVSAVFNRHLLARARRELIATLTADGAYVYEKIETGGRPSGVLYNAEARKKRNNAKSLLTCDDAEVFSRTLRARSATTART